MLTLGGGGGEGGGVGVGVDAGVLTEADMAACNRAIKSLSTSSSSGSSS